MALTFPTPPTFASPVLVNPSTGQNQFNPIWLQWFLVLAQYLGENAEGRIRDVIPVTSSGTYQPSNGTNNLLYGLWGGGGGGGNALATSSSQISVGGGGGAGGFAFGVMTSGFSGAVLTVGAAGLPDSNGSATTFNGVVASGGIAGISGTVLTGAGVTLGGAGGSSTGGAVNGHSAGGSPGLALSGTVGVSGQGASSSFGQGGLPVSSSSIGNNALGYAAGGGGALSIGPVPITLLGGYGTGGVAFLLELT